MKIYIFYTNTKTELNNHFRMWLPSWYCLCFRKECSTQMRPWSRSRRGWRSRRGRRTWISRRGMKITLSSRYIYFSKKIASKTKLVYKLKKWLSCFFKPECVLLPKNILLEGLTLSSIDMFPSILHKNTPVLHLYYSWLKICILIKIWLKNLNL